MCLVPIFLAINPAKIFNSSEVVTQIIRLASSAPASNAAIINSSVSIPSDFTVMIPFFLNIQETAPSAPRFPSLRENVILISDAVLFLLSVTASTMNAVPAGP